MELFALGCNLVNGLRSLASPEQVAQWSLATMREGLIEIGARIVRHGRHIVLQLTWAAVPRALVAEPDAGSTGREGHPWRPPDRSEPRGDRSRGENRAPGLTSDTRAARLHLRVGVQRVSPAWSCRGVCFPIDRDSEEEQSC